MTIAQEIEARGIQKGRQEGRQEGKEEAYESVAKLMLLEGYDFNSILKLTGLTSEKLLALKKSLH